MERLEPLEFIIYTMVSSACFGTALFWVIVYWLRADERILEAEQAVEQARRQLAESKATDPSSVGTPIRDDNVAA